MHYTLYKTLFQETLRSSPSRPSEEKLDINMTATVVGFQESLPATIKGRNVAEVGNYQTRLFVQGGTPGHVRRWSMSWS
ncbi:hypothetical protein DPMN_007044 [Dreissena polymorpha]|uniref:Uncharacterized protein n=1 Tax=Dreissena polymorpha TaxID=45954 RepID=A0A9D4RVY2_DREPO|nr:hypothetical protein DPMN_007044 [Dreissena polymorpha]